MLQHWDVCDESRNILRVGLQKLQISENQNCHEKGEHGGDVLGFEAENPKRGSNISVGDGVVTEWAGWQPVASAGGEKSVIGDIFEAPEISLLGSSSGEKLVENMVGPFFVG